MTHRTVDPHASPDETPHGVLAHALSHPETVVIVSRSQVNLIVLSRIAERARLRVISCGPDLAGAAIADRDPIVVILDGGSDLHECDAALGPIAVRKRISGGSRPHVIMLTMQNMNPDTIDKGGLIDSLVAKPVTPERLQPLIETVRDSRA